MRSKPISQSLIEIQAEMLIEMHDEMMEAIKGTQWIDERLRIALENGAPEAEINRLLDKRSKLD